MLGQFTVLQVRIFRLDRAYTGSNDDDGLKLIINKIIIREEEEEANDTPIIVVLPLINI